MTETVAACAAFDPIALRGIWAVTPGPRRVVVRVSSTLVAEMGCTPTPVDDRTARTSTFTRTETFDMRHSDPPAISTSELPTVVTPERRLSVVTVGGAVSHG